MLQTDLKFAEIGLRDGPALDRYRPLDFERAMFGLEPFLNNGSMDCLAADAKDLGRLRDGIAFRRWHDM